MPFGDTDADIRAQSNSLSWVLAASGPCAAPATTLPQPACLFRSDSNDDRSLMPQTGRCLVSRAGALVQGDGPLWMQIHVADSPQFRQAAAVPKSRCAVQGSGIVA